METFEAGEAGSVEEIYAGDEGAIESSGDGLSGVQIVDSNKTSRRRRVEWKSMICSIYLTSTAGSKTKDPGSSRYTTLATYFPSGNRPIAADWGWGCRTTRLRMHAILTHVRKLARHS